jgi:hypothetical protein
VPTPPSTLSAPALRQLLGLFRVGFGKLDVRAAPIKVCGRAYDQGEGTGIGVGAAQYGEWRALLRL